PKRIATPLGTLGQLLYAINPKSIDYILNSAYHLFPDSRAAREGKDDRRVGRERVDAPPTGDEQASREPVAFAYLSRGVPWSAAVFAVRSSIRPTSSPSPPTRPTSSGCWRGAPRPASPRSPTAAAPASSAGSSRGSAIATAARWRSTSAASTGCSRSIRCRGP